MSDWPQVTLEEICGSVKYGANVGASDEATGRKLLRITDIVPARIDWDRVPYCQLAEDTAAGFELQTGDIVVARTGATVGYAKYLRNPPLGSVFASYLVRFQTGELADAAFIGHLVQSAAYKKFVAGQAGGAAQPNANARVLGSFRFGLPELAIQRRIAALLNALDDLIEVRERMIDILERFVGSFYRHLVPATVGAGELPAGFRVCSLGEIAGLKYGKALPKRSRRPGGVPVVGSAGVVGTHDTAIVDGPGLVVGRKGNVGSLSWLEDPFFPIDTTYYVESDLPLQFIYWALQGAEFIDSHAAVPGLNRDHALAVPVTVPPPGVIAEVSEVHRRAFEAISTYRHAISTARSVGNLLVERTVSGRLDLTHIDLGALEPKVAR